MNESPREHLAHEGPPSTTPCLSPDSDLLCHPLSSRFLQDLRFTNKLLHSLSCEATSGALRASRHQGKVQAAERGSKQEPRGDFLWLMLLRGEEQAVRTPPSGIKICEFMNLARLEGQPLLCVDRGFGVSIDSVWTLSLSMLDTDPNKRISIRAK